MLQLRVPLRIIVRPLQMNIEINFTTKPTLFHTVAVPYQTPGNKVIQVISNLYCLGNCKIRQPTESDVRIT